MKKLIILLFFIFIAVCSGIYFVFFRSAQELNLSTSRADASSVEWETLRLLDVTSESLPNEIKAINGLQIKIPGFIIPLEDNQDFVHEFLFVPSPMACIHVPPPPPNQIIHVIMASGKTAKMSYGPVWLFGKLILTENAGKKVHYSYDMVGLATTPYR
jgi:hypothetical protein